MKLLWEQDMVKVTRLDALENGAGGMRTYAIFLTLYGNGTSHCGAWVVIGEWWMVYVCGVLVTPSKRRCDQVSLSFVLSICVQPHAKSNAWIYMKCLAKVGLGPV